MKYKFQNLKKAGFVAAAIAVGSTSTLEAARFESDNGKITGSFDHTLTIGLGMRVEGPDNENIGIGNGGRYPTLNEDDGNLNFGAGSFYSKSVKTVHELELNYDDKWSFFSRAISLYDFDIMRDSTFRTPLSDSAKDDLGHELKFLDAYWTYDTKISNNPVTFKVGNQVLSWGESTFIQNGLNVINPFDVSKFRVAGAELREGLLPVPMAVMSVEMNDKFSFETFWQWSHRKTKIDPAGSLFSDNDFVSPGATFAHIGRGQGTDLLTAAASQFDPVFTNPGFGQVARRGHPGFADPEDEGNMGIAFKWYNENLNYTEFGFYAMRYTSRLPAISGFQGAQDLGILGAVSGLSDARNGQSGLSQAIGGNVAYNNLNANAQGSLDQAFQAARGGAFGAQLQGKANLQGQTVGNMKDDLIRALAGAGRLGTAANTAVNTTVAGSAAGNAALAAAIGARAAEVAQTVYIPNSYYFLEYPEDIMMYGVSFNTMIGTLALQGEYSLKIDQPIQIDDEVLLAAALGAPGQLGTYQTAGGAGVIRGWNPKDVSQAQLTMTQLLGKKFGSDNTAFVAEVGYTKVHNMEPLNVLRYEAPGTSYGVGFPSSFSWGYRLAARADYFNFWKEVSLHPSIAFNHDVNGTTPKPIGNFVEGRQSMTIAFEARYQNTYSAKLSYTNFFGDDVTHTSRDKDFVTFSISKFF